jgi:hypothetical protein
MRSGEYAMIFRKVATRDPTSDSRLHKVPEEDLNTRVQPKSRQIGSLIRAVRSDNRSSEVLDGEVLGLQEKEEVTFEIEPLVGRVFDGPIVEVKAVYVHGGWH